MNGECVHGLNYGVGEIVGLLLGSILGIWTVSQLQGHKCADYRYIIARGLSLHTDMEMAGLHGSASCCLVTTSFLLAGRQTPLSSSSPDICFLLLTLLCSLWGQFGSESGICLCPCFSPRLPLLTMSGWKPCSGRHERELFPFSYWSANTVSTAKSSDQEQQFLLIPSMTISFLSLLVCQQSFVDFQLHFH